MNVKFETAHCVICKAEFQRRVGRGRLYCDREKCQKIKKLKNTVARFDDLPSPTMSPSRADRLYYGGYHD